MNFVADGDENKWLSGIGAGPIEGYTKKTGSNEYEWSNIFNDGYVQQYFGPDSLMEYDTVMISRIHRIHRERKSRRRKMNRVSQ